jgi:hypothetical protein
MDARVPSMVTVPGMLGRGAMSMYAAVLDHTVTEIAAIAADPRHFDRHKVTRLADIWDNNTYPLFQAALLPTGWQRNRRARAGLRWMAAFGADRRAWMIEQVGPDLTKLLGRAVPDSRHYRDHRGTIRPSILPLDIPALTADYDLSGAMITKIDVERAGDRLTGAVGLTAPRLFPASESAREPAITVSLGDLREFEFDSAGIATPGVVMAATSGGVEITFGARSRFAGADATVWIDDDSWCFSRAGLAADAVTPKRKSRRRELPRGSVTVPDTALVLHSAMLEMRMIRHAPRAGLVRLRDLCETLSGAGTRILEAAAAQRGGDRTAFDRLALEWLRPHPELARSTAALAEPRTTLHDFAVGVRKQQVKQVPPAVDPAAALHEAANPASRTRLTFISYGTAKKSLTVNYVAGDDGWRLYGAEPAEVDRIALSTSAFTWL